MSGNAPYLDRPAPVLIDERQLVPSLWSQVRRAVNDRQQTGQFIMRAGCETSA